MMSTTARRPSDAFAFPFDTLVERLVNARGDASASPAAIPVNLWETDAAYHAALLIPGLAADSIQVTIEDGQVTVAAERKSLAIDGARALWTDFGPATYRRAFRVGATLDAAKAEASYQDGVLRLVLPKSPEAQPRRITVQVPGASAS
jgi:HSP20 family protein